jgi:hypothetical protein
MKKIRLTQKLYTIVDDIDFDALQYYSWCAVVDIKSYAVSYIENKITGIHRVIIGAKKGQHVDHINGNTLDNRRCNLRICTHSQNQMNQKIRTTGTSKYKGVHRYKPTGRWRSQIRIKGKKTHLGYFADEKEAARTYDRAAVKYFGEFAKLNFNKKGAKHGKKHESRTE